MSNFNKNINLESFNFDENFNELVRKLNSNFREIKENGGGPKGEMGPQGVPGCRGVAGPQGLDGEDAESMWSEKNSIDCLDISRFDVKDTIVNKKTDYSLLLTNLTEKEGKLISTSIGDDEVSVEKISNVFKEYKHKIYNSDDLGTGGHIHLLNSKAVENDSRFLCVSGFTISNDWELNNEEVLRVIGRENNSISNHKHVIENHVDLFRLQRTKGSQQFQFDPGTKTVGEFQYRLTNRLVDLKKNNVVSIPDKTGFNAVWVDSNEHSEKWEVINPSDIVITHSRVVIDEDDTETEGDVITKNEGDNHFISIGNESYVRFKRMNEWVLIDYRLSIGRNLDEDITSFFVKNFQIRVDKPTIGCQTGNWHTSTVLEDENYLTDDDMLTEHGFFKISSSTADNTDDTFIISNKFLNNVGPLLTDTERDEVWVSGQVWATVKEQDDFCITLDIEQVELCAELDIVENEAIDPGDGQNSYDNIITLTSENILNKSFTLPDYYGNLELMSIYRDNGIKANLDVDYTITTNREISWAGYNYENVLNEGDKINLIY